MLKLDAKRLFLMRIASVDQKWCETLGTRYWIQLQIILAVLLKGMMRLPEPDFVMYKALLSSLNDPDMDKNVKRALGKWH